MKKPYLFRTFVYSQLLYALITVTVCTSVSSALSYQILQSRITDTIIASNETLIESASYRINALLSGNASEIYMKFLSDTSKIDCLSYYTNSPLIKDITSTLDVRDYLTGIVNANDTLSSIALFYPKNHLLITNSSIRYDLFYSERYLELAGYFSLLEEINTSADRSIFHISVVDDGRILRFARPILIGTHVESILIIEYNVTSLRDELTYVDKPGIYHYGDLLTVDEDGRVLFSLADNYTGQSLALRPEFFEAFSGSAGYYSTDIEGEASIITYRASSNSNKWRYIAIVPTITFFAQSRFVLTSIILSASITLIIGILIIGILSIWRSKPLLSIVQLCHETHSYEESTVDTQRVLSEPYGLIRGTLTELRDTVEEQNRTLDAVGNVLRENLSQRLLSEAPPSAAELADYLLLMQLRFPFPNYTVLAILLHDDIEEENDFEYEYVLANVLLDLRRILNTSDITTSFVKRGSILYGLANYRCPHTALVDLLNEYAASPVYGYTVYCATSGVLSELQDVSSQLPSVAALLDNSFLYPDRHCFTPALPESFTSAVSNDAQNAVLSALTERNAVKFSDALLTLISMWRDAGLSPLDVHTIISEIGDRLGGYTDVNTRREIGCLCASATSIYALHERLSAIAEDAFSHETTFSADSTAGTRLVARAKALIDDNLQNPQLSLQMVAVELHVSTAYLSRVFCRNRGQTFIDYVTGAKMELGRSLLLDTDLCIREISERLGYTSAQYFISRFKKQYGLTPTVYREEHKKSL
ncbi:MAG: helix-turn-helix domain-containing protein [Clostridiaceae bacterium]|nr:helix-turn-helix domain-containing protein [Clostridiaceae bacterium]